MPSTGAKSGAQFSATGEPGLLATAEAGVRRLLQHSTEPPPKELWDTPIPADEANFGTEVAASIVEWICERLSDYHANFQNNAALMQVTWLGCLCAGLMLWQHDC